MAALRRLSVRTVSASWPCVKIFRPEMLLNGRGVIPAFAAAKL